MENVVVGFVNKGRLIHKGAEANIYLLDYMGEATVLKIRVRKKYRDKLIDRYLVRSRTYKEAYVLEVAEKLGVPAPRLIYASINGGILIMSYIGGEILRDLLLHNMLSEKEKEFIFRRLGMYLSRLHNNGITHGDLTTSNIIISGKKELYLIDFGLANLNSSDEEKSVDVEMFERVLLSTHTGEAGKLFRWFIDEYVRYIENPDEILRRYRIIKRSGRYHAQKS